MPELSTAVAAVEQASSASPRTRLHITPFNQALLNAYLPASLQNQANSISFHSVQTFPEKGFGYIELPAAEAQKLKQKLNGATLRGQKIRIEVAKPQKRLIGGSTEDEEMQDEGPSRKKPKKEKSKDGVLKGVILEDDRKVKRGWTESVAEKKERKKKGKEPASQEKDTKSKGKNREASKYTTDSEMLFRTKVPPNVASNTPAKASKATKKDKDGDKKGKQARTVVVHEFEKTQKYANFLKGGNVDADGKTTNEYVDGKGWIDENGDLVEEEPISVKKRSKKRKAEVVEESKSLEEDVGDNLLSTADPAQKDNLLGKPRKATVQTVVPIVQNDTLDADDQLNRSAKKKRVSFAAQDQRRSPSVSSAADTNPISDSSPDPSSTDSSASDSSESESDNDSDENTSELVSQATRPVDSKSNVEADPYAIQSDLVNMYRSVRSGSTIQPVKPLSVDTSFSFFGGGGDEDIDSTIDNEDDPGPANSDNPPLTPFTRRDREWRELRSAAPTPDTAAANRHFDFSTTPSAVDDDDKVSDGDEVMAGADQPIGNKDDAAEQLSLKSGRKLDPAATKEHRLVRVEAKEESEFSKWFWEHRGENNRAWKKRRREAMKVKRSRENRRLARKVI